MIVVLRCMWSGVLLYLSLVLMHLLLFFGARVVVDVACVVSFRVVVCGVVVRLLC